jgi:hypothetical protein
MGAVGLTLWTGAPTSDWYYVFAQCNWDRNSAVNAKFARRGDSTDTIRLNEGR